MEIMKRLLLSGIAVFGLAFHTVTAQAALTSTITGWQSSPINDGAATWTLVSTDLPGILSVSFNTSVSGGTGFSIQSAQPLGTMLYGSWNLVYRVVLNDSSLAFNSVFVDSTIGVTGPLTGSGTQVQKTITTLGANPTTLAVATSINGNTSGQVLFPNSVNGMLVTETIYADMAGSRFLSDFQNSYAVVPEPSTMVAGGLLLVPFAVGFFRRRQSR